MALKKCRECDGEVSTGAKTCPHCGVDRPAGPTAEDWAGFIVLGVVVAQLERSIEDRMRLLASAGVVSVEEAIEGARRFSESLKAAMPTAEDLAAQRVEGNGEI